MSSHFYFKRTLSNCKILTKTDLLRFLKTDSSFSCHTPIFLQVNFSLSMRDIYIDFCKFTYTRPKIYYYFYMINATTMLELYSLTIFLDSWQVIDLIVCGFNITTSFTICFLAIFKTFNKVSLTDATIP